SQSSLSMVAAGVFDEDMVVIDHNNIARIIEQKGGRVFMSRREQQSGSDRIAVAVQDLDAEVVVNVQGDEPFQDRNSLQDLVEVFRDGQVEVASMMARITDPSQIENPNVVRSEERRV